MQPVSGARLLLLVIGLTVVRAIVLFVLAPAFFETPDQIFQPSLTGVMLVLAAAALGTAWIWLILRPHERVLVRAWWRRPSPAEVTLALGTGVLLAAGLFVYAALMGESADDLRRALVGASAAQRGLFLLVGIQAALLEETVFRGVLLSALPLAKPWQRLVLSTLVFALYHLQSPIGLLGKVWVGLGLGLLQQRTQNLFAAAIAHVFIWFVAGSL